VVAKRRHRPASTISQHVPERASTAAWCSFEQAAAIAHDMRTPLSTITTSAELLEQEMHGNESAELLRVIQRQTYRLQEMIQNLAESLRSPEEGVILRARVHDLAGIIREVITEFRGIARDHSLCADLTPSPVRAYVDAEKVRRILQNLLFNAMQYSPKGTSISVRLSVTGAEEALIEVEDEGPGVPEASRDEIFAPFMRLERSWNSGQGLGLHIVRSFAIAHHGRAWVEDGTVGARFCVALPIMPAVV
jgi:signal transduction histidine kinase